MARPLRLEFAGAVWHITSRGNERKEIFRDDEDRSLFLRLLARMACRFTWRIHAFVLMGNHYHLLLDTPEPTLSRGMRELNGIYTQRFNRRHERVGHLLQGRFKGILVQRDSHLLELTRYVVLNPVRAGLATKPEQWRWSSYPATAGLRAPPRWLEVDWTLSQFALQREAAQALYRDFVAAGCRDPRRPWDMLRGQIFLGNESFHREIRTRIEAAPVSDEVPRSQRFPSRPSLDEVMAVTAAEFKIDSRELRQRRGGPARAIAALLAREEALESLDRIGRVLSIKASRVAKLVARTKRLLNADPSLRLRAREIALRCRECREGRDRQSPEDLTPSGQDLTPNGQSPDLTPANERRRGGWGGEGAGPARGRAGRADDDVAGLLADGRAAGAGDGEAHVVGAREKISVDGVLLVARCAVAELPVPGRRRRHVRGRPGIRPSEARLPRRKRPTRSPRSPSSAPGTRSPRGRSARRRRNPCRGRRNTGRRARRRARSPWRGRRRHTR